MRVVNDVVDGAADLTPGWFTEILQARGHDLVATSATAERVGTGQMGTTYRVALSYDGPPGPPTLIAKVAGGDESMRALVAPGYAAEIGFYRHLASQLDVRTPRCWHAGIVPDHTRFTLLLNDLAPARPGVQADGCSLEEARAAIGNLVGLHAPRWGDPTLHELDFLMRPSEPMAAVMKDVLVGATEIFIERYASRLDDQDLATLRAVAEVIDAWQLTGLDPSAVVHGDYRLDNLMFSPNGEVTALDWQSAAVGAPLRDVAYFLGTSLATDARRASEEELVAEYHAEIIRRGIAGYDADRCWQDYRRGQLQGPMIGIIGCIYASGERTERSDAMFLALVGRAAAAIRDLRSLDLV